MLKRWHHGHTLVAGVATGAAVTHGPLGALLLVGVGLAVGLGLRFAIDKARDAAAYAAELVDARERRANARVAIETDRNSRARAREARLDDRHARLAQLDQTDEVPF